MWEKFWLLVLSTERAFGSMANAMGDAMRALLTWELDTEGNAVEEHSSRRRADRRVRRVS